jgi:proline dehydrogenase
VDFGAFSILPAVEGGFGAFGGDPEDLLRGLREFAEQQAETVQEAQREQFATLTLNTAVELTAAALSQLNVEGASDEQALALRDAMRVLFPEAVALVSAARQGFMRER